MKLLTKVPILPSPAPIGYDSRIILLGSCFVTNIGDKLNYFKFRIVQNPFGIVYHPQAIEKLLRRAINREAYTGDEVFFHNELWHCFDAHSQISTTGSEALIANLNLGLETLRNALQESTHLVITLGTAWVYRTKANGKTVANCHKIPQAQFEKELLTADEVADSLKAIIGLIRGVNPRIHCLFTISPVRHLKDGFTGNLRSKARLIDGVHRVLEGDEGNTGLHYFPAYEIMMDELRDYRFYGEDLVHPNPLAIQYIWEIFKENAIARGAFPVMEMVDTIQKGLKHKPFNPGSKMYGDFRRSLEEKIEYLKGQYDHITFES